jgi:hypothetical protein
MLYMRVELERFQRLSHKQNDVGSNPTPATKERDMRRYVIFVGINYYPEGGWDDYLASYETKEEALGHFEVRKDDHDWIHVVDIETRTILMRRD